MSEPLNPESNPVSAGRRLAALLSAELESNGWGDIDPYWIKLAATQGDPGDYQNSDDVRSLHSDDVRSLRSIFERVAEKFSPSAHDEGAAPPPFFARYQVEIDLHDDVDPSTLLERAQEFVIELNGFDLDDEIGVAIADRVSIQRMEG